VTEQQIKFLRDKALSQTGKPLSAAVAITPGELLELCRLASLGLLVDAQAGNPL
jgi:hypothetical protein